MMPRARVATLAGLLTLLPSALAFAQPARRPPPADASDAPADAAVPDAAVPEAPPADAAVAAPVDAATEADASAPELPPPPPAVPAAPPSPPAPAVAPTGPRTAVIDAAPIGVDAAAGRYVTNVLREAVASMGFQVIPEPELYDAARRLALPFPVPADGIYTLERALQAPLALTAEVRAAQGQYVVHLRVRVAVEPEERVRDVSASQFQLGAAIREALPPLLVPPRPATAAAPSPAMPDPDDAAEPAAPARPARRRRRPRAHPQHWELSVGAIVALGPGRDGFVNGIIAARASYFPSDRLGFSLTGAYVNLRGREERVSNALILAGVETAVDLIPSRRIFIPLRAEIGYLPQNGPVFRLTAGVSFSLSRRVRLNVDLLSPTLWVLPETTPVTLDLGAHLVIGL